MTLRLLLAAAVVAVTLSGATAAPAKTCAAEIGPRDAKVLAERCTEVSPATRPPCNVENSCALIREEIRRSCEILAGDDDSDEDDDAPDWCAEYTR